MTDNTCVVYIEPDKISVEKIDSPKLELPPEVPGRKRKCEQGVILRIVATTLCGSDLHNTCISSSEALSSIPGSYPTC
jgi:glutathione-independent formaldehyde dehydrogenase